MFAGTRGFSKYVEGMDVE